LDFIPVNTLLAICRVESENFPRSSEFFALASSGEGLESIPAALGTSQAASQTPAAGF
jgi:hypothetical protein